MNNNSIIVPDWLAPANVHAFTTNRLGGYSQGEFAGLNLGDHVGDARYAVELNRSSLQLATNMPEQPHWLNQVHGNEVVQIDHDTAIKHSSADASFTSCKNKVLVIMTADCLPVLLCNKSGTIVAAIHCGWRSLVADILELTISRMHTDPKDIIAWLGPCISQQYFEVGEDVYQAFCDNSGSHRSAFKASASTSGKYFCDIQHIAQQKLNAIGLNSVNAAKLCTYADNEQFYSYRRDGKTGRMATFIWFS